MSDSSNLDGPQARPVESLRKEMYVRDEKEMVAGPLNVNKVECRAGRCACEKVARRSEEEIELAGEFCEREGEQTPFERTKVGALNKTLRYLKVLKGQTMQTLLLGMGEPFVQCRSETPIGKNSDRLERMMSRRCACRATWEQPWHSLRCK